MYGSRFMCSDFNIEQSYFGRVVSHGRLEPVFEKTIFGVPCYRGAMGLKNLVLLLRPPYIRWSVASLMPLPQGALLLLPRIFGQRLCFCTVCMYVRMYVCTHVCMYVFVQVVCTHVACKHLLTMRMVLPYMCPESSYRMAVLLSICYAGVYTRTYTCTYTYMYAYTHTYTHIPIHIYIYIFVYPYAYPHICLDTCMYRHTHTLTRTRTHTHTHAYTYTYTYTYTH